MRNNISISISPATILLILLTIGLVFVAYELRDLLVIILFSLILSSGLSSAQNFLKRFGIHEVISTIFLYICFLLLLVSIIYLFLPVLVEQFEAVASRLPGTFERLAVWLNESSLRGSIVSIQSSFDFSAVITEVVSAVKSKFSNLYSSIFSIFGSILTFLLMLILTFFFSIQQAGITRFIASISPDRYEKYILDLWFRFQKKMGSWLQGQLLLCTMTGVLMFLGFVLIGIPNALLLALIAGVFEFLPVLGPFIASILPIMIALSSGDYQAILFIIALTVLVQQLQANLIYPLVVQKVVGIPAVLVFLSVIAGAILGGVLGMILAIPLAALFQELYKDLQSGYFRKITSIPAVKECACGKIDCPCRG